MINEESETDFIVKHIKNCIGDIENSMYVCSLKQSHSGKIDKLRAEKNREIGKLKKQLYERNGIINYLETRNNKNRKDTLIETTPTPTDGTNLRNQF